MITPIPTHVMEDPQALAAYLDKLGPEKAAELVGEGLLATERLTALKKQRLLTDPRFVTLAIEAYQVKKAAQREENLRIEEQEMLRLQQEGEQVRLQRQAEAEAAAKSKLN